MWGHTCTVIKGYPKETSTCLGSAHMKGNKDRQEVELTPQGGGIGGVGGVGGRGGGVTHFEFLVQSTAHHTWGR